jgi:hypothetical protein
MRLFGAAEHERAGDDRRFFAALLGGVALRLALPALGHNQDLETIFSVGQLPFPTDFYEVMPYFANWGPLPYWAFQALARLPGGATLGTFHLGVAALMTSCDVVTTLVLRRCFGLRPAVVFLFSPAAFIIAGYHCNAEPALMAAAMVGLLLARRGAERGETAVPVGAHVAIGLSLAMKHALVFFPLWVALRPQPWKERARGLLLAYGTWGLALSPFFLAHPRAVLLNVFGYRGWVGNGLVPTLLDPLLSLGTAALAELGVSTSLRTPLFVACMLAVGWAARTLPFERLLLLYAPALVGFSPAIASQYLALPSAAWAVAFGPLTVAWQGLAGLVMSAHPDELHLFSVPRGWLENGGWLSLQAGCVALVARTLWARRAGG